MQHAARAAHPAQTGTTIKGVLMMSRASAVAACSVLLGLVLGFSFGQDWGWLSAQVALAAQLALLRHINTSGFLPARLALAGAAFSAAMAIAAYSDFCFSVAAGFGRELLLAGLLLIPLHAVVGASIAALAARASGTSLLRWALAWPALWALQEWAFGMSDLALPWLRLGSLQAAPGPLVGFLPLGGSLLAGLAMGWCALALLGLWQREQRKRTGAVLLALLGLSALGRQDWTAANGDFSASFVQAPSENQAGIAELLGVVLHAAATSPGQLLLTPQLMLPKTEQALPTGLLDEVRSRLNARDADLLLGLYAQAPNGFYNAAISLGTSGDQRYLKRQLFPLGEFLPAQGLLRDWLQSATPTQRQDMARAGGPMEPLWLGGHRAALNICYELAFPSLWRAEAAASDLIVNLSSDSSHPGEGLARQTRQIAQARALEFQKPLLRSSDLSPGLAIDHLGRVLALQTRGLDSTVRLQTRQGLTPFARLGDSLTMAAAVLSLLSALLAAPARQESRRIPALIIHCGRVAQSGQILMATVALLLVSAAMLYFMVNSGQTVTEKMRVTNAADAGAYSAGLVQARVLNYDAYLNRAMVANEIAIAQMVSFGSWLRYFGTAVDYVPATAFDIETYLFPNPDATKIVAIFAATDFVLEYFTGTSATEYATEIVDYGIGPIIAVHDAVVVAMSYAQEAAHLNLVLGLRQGQIANDVAKAMDPGLKAQVVLTSYGFDNFTKSYAKNGSTGDERGRFADVTMRSRDQFTSERNWTIASPRPPIPFLPKGGALKKRGGTDLVGYDEWRGIDTLELHGEPWGCGKIIKHWCDDIQEPVGWGAVNVNTGGGDAGHGYHGNAYGENGNTASIADGDMQEPGYTSFHGIPDSREIRDLDPKADLSTGITILVSKQHKDLLTSGGAASAKPAGELALFDDKPAGAKMIALARAQVYFDRIAKRADGKTEIGSLYNPYWRVRLVAPTLGDRAWAAAQQGGMALPPIP